MKHSNKIVLTDLLIILSLGLLSITWFRGDFLIKAGDSFFSLSPSYDLIRNSYVWDSLFSTGIPNPRSPALLPYTFFIVTLQTMFSLVTSQKILIYAIFTLSGVGMYYLCHVVVARQYRRITGLFSAFFYMMNPFTLTNVWGTHLISIIFAYSLLPLIMGFFIRGLHTKNVRYFLLLIILWVVFSIAAVNPAFSLPILFSLLLYMGFYILKKGKNKRAVLHGLKWGGFSTASFIIGNFWWILPSLFSINQQLEGAKVSGAPLAIFIGGSGFASILNSFRLLGMWTLYSSHFDPYFLWISTYSTPLFILTSLFIPVLVFAALLLKDKLSPKKDVLFFAILCLGGLFVIKGAHPPFGSINIWVFRSIPLAGMLRSIYEKFGMVVVFSYAFLFGISISCLYYYLKRRVGHSIHILLLAAFFLIVNVIYVFPFWTGDVIYSGGNTKPSHRIRIPEYYERAGEWINRQRKNFRILTLPAPSIAGTSAYAWDYGYAGSDPLVQSFFHDIPIVTMGLTGNLGVDNLQRQLVKPFYDGDNSVSIERLLGLVNIRYILFHRDFNIKYSSSPPLYQFESVLKGQEKIKLVKTFGQIDFYELPDKYLLSRIYVSN